MPHACRRLLSLLPLTVAVILMSGCPPPALRIPRGYQRWPWRPAFRAVGPSAEAESPLGTHAAIVLSPEEGGLRVLARRAVDGNPQVLASDGVQPQFWPNVSPWAPDGLALVYVQHGNLIYRRLAGKPRQLTTTGDIFTPAISPDGRQVAFGRLDAKQQDLGLWVAPAKGGEPRQLVPPTGDVFHACCPHWSPDGKWIAFLQAYEGGALGIVAADGSEVRPGIEAAWEPVRWLPDSRTVVFSKTVYGEGGDGIYSYHVETKETGLVAASGRNATYALSPDGRRILVASWLERSDGQVSDSKVQVVSLATLAPEGQPVKLNGSVGRCLWAPDGRQKALLVRGAGGKGKLWYTANDLANLKPVADAVALYGWERLPSAPPRWQFWRR